MCCTCSQFSYSFPVYLYLPLSRQALWCCAFPCVSPVDFCVWAFEFGFSGSILLFGFDSSFRFGFWSHQLSAKLIRVWHFLYLYMKSLVILWKKKKPHNAPGVISFKRSRQHCQWKQRETNAGVVIWNLSARTGLWNHWPSLMSMLAEHRSQNVVWKIGSHPETAVFGKSPRGWGRLMCECVVAIGACCQLLTMLDGSYGSRDRSRSLASLLHFKIWKYSNEFWVVFLLKKHWESKTGNLVKTVLPKWLGSNKRGPTVEPNGCRSMFVLFSPVLNVGKCSSKETDELDRSTLVWMLRTSGQSTGPRSNLTGAHRTSDWNTKKAQQK